MERVLKAASYAVFTLDLGVTKANSTLRELRCNFPVCLTAGPALEGEGVAKQPGAKLRADKEGLRLLACCLGLLHSRRIVVAAQIDPLRLGPEPHVASHNIFAEGEPSGSMTSDNSAMRLFAQ